MKLLLDSVDGLTSGLHRRMRNSRAVIGRGSATSDHRRRGTIAALPQKWSLPGHSTLHTRALHVPGTSKPHGPLARGRVDCRAPRTRTFRSRSPQPPTPPPTRPQFHCPQKVRPASASNVCVPRPAHTRRDGYVQPARSRANATRVQSTRAHAVAATHVHVVRPHAPRPPTAPRSQAVRLAPLEDLLARHAVRDEDRELEVGARLGARRLLAEPLRDGAPLVGGARRPLAAPAPPAP